MEVVEGTIRRVYRLREIKRSSNEDQRIPKFGNGPLGRHAECVVTMELTLARSMNTSFSSTQILIIFFYNEWAKQVQKFRRRFRLQISGRSVFFLKWSISKDKIGYTPNKCCVIADKELLLKTKRFKNSLALNPEYIHSIKLAFAIPEYYMGTEQYGDVQYITDINVENKELVYDPPSRDARTKRKRDTDDLSFTGTTFRYKYTLLNELRIDNLNIYGVVVNLSLPKESAGKDYCMTLHIVDETRPKKEDAIQIVIFGKSFEDFPQINTMGDIIRFHRIGIRQHQGNFQGTSSSRSSRFLVLRKEDNSLVQRTCSKTWTFTPSDNDRVEELIKWSQEQLRIDDSLCPGCKEDAILLKDLSGFENFVDIIVQILSIVYPTSSTPGYFIISDNSGKAGQNNNEVINSAIEKGLQVPTTCQVATIEVKSCWVAMERMGFLLRIKYATSPIWCRFRNLAILPQGFDERYDEDKYELHFHETSSLMFIPPFVLDVQSRLVQRKNGQDYGQAKSSNKSITVVIPKAIFSQKFPVSSLQTLLESTSVPNIYVCRVKFVNVKPKEVLSMITPHGKTKKLIFRMKFHLKDESGDLGAILCNEDADEFFQNILPHDVHNSKDVQDELRKTINEILTLQEMVYVCIKSYRILPKCGEDKCEIGFRICNTKLAYN